MGLTRIRAEQISDIDFKQAVRVVTTADVILSGSAPRIVDGVTLIANDRVLVAGQTTGSDNGIYVVTVPGTGSNGTWTRSTDANATGEIEAGMLLMVTDGTIYADTQWVLATNNPIVVGTTALAFQQNITNTGNVSAGSSGIRVQANSNVLVSVSGTANVATFAVDGLYVTGNITSGNLAVGNNVVITGNLTVNGTTTTINSNTITTNDKSITLANNQSTSANVDGAGIDVGNPSIATWRYSNATASWQSNVAVTPASNATVTLGGAANYWSTVYANTASLAGNVTSTGAVISTINATTISASGNVTGGNINTGSLSISGNVIGSLLPAANVAYDLGSATQMWRTLYVSSNTVYIGNTALSTAAGNLTVGNSTVGGISAVGGVFNNYLHAGVPNGSVDGIIRLYNATSSQPGIVLYTDTASGAMNRGGFISASGNITGGNVIAAGGNVDAGQITAQTTISAGGNVSAPRFSATGNITGGNLNAAGLSLSGNVISFLNVTGNITGSHVNSAGNVSAVGNVMVGGFISAAGNVTGVNLFGTIQTSSQLNITQVGMLSSLNVTGNIAGGNINTLGLISASGAITGSSLSVSTGNISGGNINNTNANGVGNIGSATTYFNTVFAKATSAQYADLAEMYVADQPYAPGTVVEFGGLEEITQSTSSYSTAIAGVISTNPSYIMNAGQQGTHVLPVAFTGRVPCQVQGPVNKGDVLVSSNIPGTAQRIGAQWMPGCVIGKSLGVIADSSIQTIEVVVGRF